MKTVIEMAREAGWDDHHAKFDTRLERFAEIARAEAIAAIKEAQAEQAQQKPFGFIKPGEGDYEKVFSWNRNERNGYTQAVYTSPPEQQEPVAKVCHDLDGHIGFAVWIREQKT